MHVKEPPIGPAESVRHKLDKYMYLHVLSYMYLCYYSHPSVANIMDITCIQYGIWMAGEVGTGRECHKITCNGRMKSDLRSWNKQIRWMWMNTPPLCQLPFARTTLSTCRYVPRAHRLFPRYSRASLLKKKSHLSTPLYVIPKSTGVLSGLDDVRILDAMSAKNVLAPCRFGRM